MKNCNFEMVTHHLSSKNLTPGEKLAMTDELKEQIRIYNEKRKLEGNKLGADVTNGKAVAVQLDRERKDSKETWTDAQIAKKAGVGTGTVKRYNRVMKSSDEKLKQEVRSGQKTINKAYTEVKELGIPSVVCDVHTYNNEDEILQDLLETNIRQRGDVGGSAKKTGLRIKELERIYGIEHGNNQHTSLPNNSVSSQEQLAAQMSISVDTLQNYKLLADMIPELEELMDTGIVTKTTALAMMRNLSEKKQRKAIAEYVELCGYEHGGDRKSTCQNDNLKMSQEEIAKEFGVSVKSLNRALSIERNLTDSMKELLDTGVITKTLAADTIASLSEEEQLTPEDFVECDEANNKMSILIN